MDNQDLWNQVMAELETTLSRANYKMWLSGTFIAEESPEAVVIGVPSTFYLDWIRKNYHKNIADSIRRQRPTVRDITYKVANQTPPPAKPDDFVLEPTPQSGRHTNPNPGLTVAADPSRLDFANFSIPETPTEPVRQALSPQPTSEPAQRQAQPSDFTIQPSPAGDNEAQATPAGHSPLDPTRTFDTFIVGNSNRLAHAVSVAAAQEPGRKYNPLFLYGGVGLGKSHLAQAIGNQMRHQNPKAKITYMSCEAFTNEFIETVLKKGRDIDAFKKKFRECDTLIIDDIQFLSGKEGTQEEFFHTFNALHQAKKQIVLTSDREPKDIPALEERLTSRFTWGMVADIQAPDFETRVAILRAKCIEHHYKVEDEALQMIAQLIQSNIRELEGTLQGLITRAEIEGQTLNAEYVRRIVSPSTNRSGRSVNGRRIIDLVGEFFEIKSEDLIGPRRFKQLVYPRQLTMYLLRHELGLSYPDIGKEIGGKDHTTIMHGVDKIAKELARNDTIQYDLAKLKEKLYRNS